MFIRREYMFLIVGLGNPGREYYNTHHNIGFLCIDYISQRYNITVDKTKHKALIGEGITDGEKVVLVKPQTYMNLSGESIREIASWYKVDTKNIIIIYDDISLSVGKMRIREKGSAGGHNGVKSIIYNLQNDAFPRIKIGIGQPNEHIDLADYVLSKINDNEKEALFKVMENTYEAVNLILKGNILSAMNKYN
jgi:PTH1 family peptidyl-tRNA hydrolase